MSSIYQFSQTEMLAFTLVLLRVSSFLVSWPVFSGANIPARAKVLFSLAITIVIFPVIQWKGMGAGLDSSLFLFYAIKEVLVGVAMGFVCRMFFFAVNIAGQLMSLSIGLTSAQLYNPFMGFQSSVLEEFQLVLASMFFLGLNGHHIFLSGLNESFNLIPLAISEIKFGGFGSIGSIVQEVIFIGLKFAAPVIVSTFLMNVAMGIVGRTVPQINVLVSSLPVNILIGFLIMIVSIPLFVDEMNGLLNLMSSRLFQFMRAF